MSIDYDALRFYLDFANTIGLIGVSLYVWVSGRQKVNTSAIEALKESVTTDMTIIESRFARIETDIRHLPTHNDMGQVYARVNEVAETLSAVQGQLVQMNAGVQLIHQHLLSQGDRR